MNWTTECKDWERRILNGESLIPFPPLFPDEAEEGLSYFKQLHLKDVLGCPTYGEVGKQWQFDFVSHIFGAYDPDAGASLIKEFFLMVGKKNDKSGSAAGIMITKLLRNWRESAEFVIIAPTVNVANNSFKPARDMINTDPDLKDLLKYVEHQKLIEHRNTGATLKIVAADSDTVSGIKATTVLVEELWAFGKKEKATNMIKEVTGGLVARPEGAVIYLTTQSDEAPAGIYADKLEYSRGVRDGRINDPTFLPVIYEFPKHMIESKQYLEKRYWYIPNPNLNASVSESELERFMMIAEEEGPHSMQGFLAKHLNVQIATSLRAQRWAGADYWDEAEGDITLDGLLERSEVVVIGIDGGGLDDLLGFAIIGREKGTGDWLLWNKAWANPIALERRKSEASKYKDFAKDGDLVIVNKIGQDIDQLGKIVRRCLPLLDRVGVDQLGIGSIADELEGGDEKGEGKIEHDRIVGIPQGYKLNGAIKTLERKLAEGTVIHGGQPLMSWCVGNARVEPKGNAVSITKQASGAGKIDPLMATLDAVVLMAMEPAAKVVESAYKGLTVEQINERMRL